MTAPADIKAHPGYYDSISVATWGEAQQYVVSFKHQPTGHKVTFPAIISSFSDTHTPSFGQTHGASMHDPIITLKKTDRRISFTLTVLNGSLVAARHNRQCVNLLILRRKAIYRHSHADFDTIIEKRRTHMCYRRT